ncbi:MAG: dihydroorotate dehydrogenase, partial [Bradymonadia bacterium]
DALSDYLVSLERLVPYARYVAVNVSSPNTAGLRDLQHADALRSLLEGLLQRNQELAAERGADAPPMLVKIAPDLSDEQLDEIVELAESLGLDGIIATNTTIARAPLKTDAAEIEAIGAGGLSGAPLTSRSREVVARLYARCGGRLTIMGVGGIEDGDDAYEMMRAGASAVQLYTGFIYGGPNIIRSINERLLERLEADGLRHISEAVGAAHRESGAPA